MQARRDSICLWLTGALLMTTQKATLRSCVHFPDYRHFSPQFQVSLSAAALSMYLYGWIYTKTMDIPMAKQFPGQITSSCTAKQWGPTTTIKVVKTSSCLILNLSFFMEAHAYFPIIRNKKPIIIRKQVGKRTKIRLIEINAKCHHLKKIYL